MSNVPRKPDLVLKAKSGKSYGNDLGKGWLNEDGSITIHLSPGAVLDWRMTAEGVSIVLFPILKDGR